MTTVSYNLENFTSLCPGAKLSMDTVTFDLSSGLSTGGITPCAFMNGYELYGGFATPFGAYVQTDTGRDAVLTLTVTPLQWTEAYMPNTPGVHGLYPWTAMGLVAPIPEPDAAIMVLGGLALLFAIVSRRFKRG